MRIRKGVAVARGAVALVAGGVGVVALQGGDGTTHKPSAQVSASTRVGSTAPTNAQDVIRSITGINQQVQSAAAQGQAMSREQIDALIKQQLAQLGINR